MGSSLVSRSESSSSIFKPISASSLEKGSDVRITFAEVTGAENSTPVQNVTLKDRLKHFTFAWYASTMSNGGIAFVLSVIPKRFTGLTTIGTIVFVFNLILFTFVTITISARFIIHRGTLVHAITNPHEGFFFATLWLTIATQISNTTAYGVPHSGPWIFVALRVAFWLYTVCTTLVAIFYYYILFTVKKLVRTFTMNRNDS
jgi:tellurite resistance protein TehA-like permease